MYSTTLLCLLTTLQLTLLARSKYVSSVLQLEREERFRERLQFELSMSNILLGGGKELENLMTGNISSILGDSDDTVEADAINEESESKYLTLSWWLLHVGWKDVGERVRRGVEEVFYGFVLLLFFLVYLPISASSSVSLKTKLAAIDLHRLISDVRRRVEHEITFEGNERRIKFVLLFIIPTAGVNPTTVFFHPCYHQHPKPSNSC